MVGALQYVARHGRLALLGGLLAGLLLPGVAALLKPWVAHLVVLLLLMTAFRIGPRAARQGLSDIRSTLGIVVILQIVAPLILLAILAGLGVAGTTYAVALVLMLSAPSMSGCPNLAVMAGADPEPAFRLLLLGTLLLPLTMIPVFWLSPQLGDLGQAMLSSFRLICAIGLAIAVGFFLRKVTAPDLTVSQTEAADGLMALALAIIVVGLMGALGPTLMQAPLKAAVWMALAVFACLGMQVISFLSLRRSGYQGDAVPISIVAGNRNVALFLVSMPADKVAPLMIFLGCYQIPMYLTPILMRRVFGLARAG